MTEKQGKAALARIELGRALNKALPVKVSGDDAVALRAAIDNLVIARIEAELERVQA